MGEEIKKILEMLETGKINTDEAERLINAISGKKNKGFVVPASPKIPKEFMMKVETIPEQVGKAVSAAFGSVGTSGGKKTFSGIDTIKAKIVSGALHFRPADGELTIDGTGWPLRTMAENNQLFVDAVNADLTAKIAPKSKASLSLVSADFDAKEIDGEVIVESISGDIELDDCAGSWSIRSISGDITAEGIAGEFVIASKSGDIAMKISGDGRYSAKTLSGDVEIELPKGKAVSLQIDQSDGEREIPPELESAIGAPPENADIVLAISTKSGNISMKVE
ncbi:MAG TPA: hypothetical protein ENN07_00485 [candidate division Zixibacteria bacterium]|nr:hypothetical protein [candidate division Zixibacteria bacterium]